MAHTTINGVHTVNGDNMEYWYEIADDLFLVSEFPITEEIILQLRQLHG